METFNEIRDLCMNRSGLSDHELVLRLQKFSQINPGVFSERDEEGGTLLHYAAMERSPEFCRVIHDQNDTLVKTKDNDGWLPVHCACRYGNVNAAKYLLELYPDSIHIPNNNQKNPLHLLVKSRLGTNENMQELLTYLLQHDRGAVSTPDIFGDLPLHIASEKKDLAFTKLLFDEHPDGIFCRNVDGDTPVDIARRSNNPADVNVVHFFETQLEFHRQAQEDQERDNNEQLPIHRVLQMQIENISLGTIKLMVGANPASVTIAAIHGCIPLHLACRFEHLDIVKYLVDKDKNSLATLDNKGNLPLHHACLAGKPDIITFILNTTDHGVA
eukprot:scaffold318559_cov30-Cyclotella_meneghiniana.AAC.1